ncbi:MAG: MBOAT family O-acyltransferase [Deltaproteobacteria bacterium]
MLFNSFEFLIFFPVVVTLYFAVPHRLRWALLLCASYFFYMWWVPEYALLIVFSTVVDYIASNRMGALKTKAERRPYMWVSVAVNLGLLFFFKYYNWVNENVTAVVGRELLPLSHLLLPMGISFYTLQTMSYTLDVYRGKLKPEKHFGVFALYVSFFPQLVAGPIERAPNLLHQFYQKHKFEYARAANGLRLMAWGMFKKVVVADRLSMFTSSVYVEPQAQDGLTLAIATVLFGFQLYCDFSGYSDIAIGTAQIIGFDLMENFKRPYFSKNIEELWGRRWHISLTSWIKDYVYNPLAFMSRRASKARKHANILIIFLITGLWHGAAWRFVFWGMLNGVYVLAHVLTEKPRKKLREVTGLENHPRVLAALGIAFTFFIFVVGSVPFLAKDMSDAWYILTHMFGGWSGAALSAFLANTGATIGKTNFALGLIGVAILFTVELFQERVRIREYLNTKPAWIRWSLTYGLILYIALFGVFEYDEFIYFQF